VGDPYRTAPDSAEAEAPRDAGIVGEVIEQFADPMAFYRELVQNAIDAGSPDVVVRLNHDPGDGLMRVTVEDQGEGMNREVIENQLLVLFRSTKEGDESKIGKFGIGFASVLAARPRLVVIQTARDGHKLTVHLRPDLSYDLFTAGRVARAGTTVELEIPMGDWQLDQFVAASRQALERWCRHACVPIRLVVGRVGAPPSSDQRIDQPLGLDECLVQVRATSPDGQTTAVVGLGADARPYAGFFDHGLTLHEGDEPLIGRLRFKVQDRRLGHTLSRDNVRRDRAFDRAVGFVRRVATSLLPSVISAQLRSSAEVDHGRHRALLAALGAAGISLPDSAWAFPLVEPMGERRAVTVSDLRRPPWGARRSSQVTVALASAGVPVVDLGPDGMRGLTAERLSAVLGSPVVDVAHHLTLVTPIEASGADLVLLDALADLLDCAYRRPSSILIATLRGASELDLAVVGDRHDASVRLGVGWHDGWLVDRDEAVRSPFGLLRRPALVLSATHATVAAARERAVSDPTSAASCLARALLLRHACLDVDRSEALLEETLSRLGVGGQR